ncbi:GLUG motif-containing protein [Anaerolentibacter hominis]|uniref:GLUG motif-containing protein n=1 Tax=Anaerolentibacter hominis TaxID=3079009 RepID=UPI0031B83592
MKKKVILWAAAAGIMLICTAGFCLRGFMKADAAGASSYFPGQGTESDPYRISTEEEFQNVFRYLNALPWRGNRQDYFVLENDIDCKGGTITGLARWNVPAFAGTFDGQGHTIRNLVLSRGYLFGDINTTGVVKNLTMDFVTVMNLEQGSGILAGDNNGRIEHCKFLNVKAEGVGGSNIGGLAGENGGIIIGCEFGGVLGKSTSVVYSGMGGIASYNKGDIIECINRARIYGVDTVGGIVSYNFGGTVADCTNLGRIYANNGVGGITGRAENSLIINCGNEAEITGIIANVSGPQAIGGLAGAIKSSELYNSYNIAEITLERLVVSEHDIRDGTIAGGLIGYAENANIELENCYAGGKITGGTESLGGIIGSGPGGAGKKAVSCYWKSNGYSQAVGSDRTDTEYDGIMELTPEQLKGEAFAYQLNDNAKNRYEAITDPVPWKLWGFYMGEEPEKQTGFPVFADIEEEKPEVPPVRFQIIYCSDEKLSGLTDRSSNSVHPDFICLDGLAELETKYDFVQFAFSDKEDEITLAGKDLLWHYEDKTELGAAGTGHKIPDKRQVVRPDGSDCRYVVIYAEEDTEEVFEYIKEDYFIVH